MRGRCNSTGNFLLCELVILELSRGNGSSIPMDLVQLVFFGGAHVLFAASSAFVAVVCRRKGMRPIACAGVASVVAVTILASIADPGSSLVMGMIREIKAIHGSSLASITLGVSTAVPWLLLALPVSGTSLTWKSRLVVPLLSISLTATILCVAVLVYRGFQK